MKNKLTTEDFYSSTKDSDEIDLGKMFRLLLMQSKLIILIVLAAFFVAYVNHSLSTKKGLKKIILELNKIVSNIA